MGKNYYCDYCERSFKDDPTARKRHLSSLQHLKNKEDHYKIFKDPETILEEEKAKNPCNRFLYKNDCLFGSSCRYSHYTPSMLQQLQSIVDERAKAKQVKSYEVDPRQAIKILEDLDRDINMDTNLCPNGSELDYASLPPSLKLITYKEFTSTDHFPEWGLK